MFYHHHVSPNPTPNVHFLRFTKNKLFCDPQTEHRKNTEGQTYLTEALLASKNAWLSEARRVTIRQK